MEIIWIFVFICALFFILLGAKELFSKKIKEKFCVICASISFTWLILLVLLYYGLFEDKTIVALLIGQSILGIFYIWEKKAKEKIKVFRLPLLLTLILIGYSFIEGFSYNFSVLIFLAVLWIFFSFIFIYRSKGKIGKLFKKILECCKRW